MNAALRFRPTISRTLPLFAAILLAICAGCSLSPQMNAQTFVPLGFLPGFNSSRALAISADGSTVVGENVDGSAIPTAFRWTKDEGMVSLGSSSSMALGVSADGSVIVGTSGNQAFRWTSGGGMAGLGDPSAHEANGVSADGNVLVGQTTSNTAYRWTSGGGFTTVPHLSGSSNTRARAVSADGNVVVGFGIGGSSAEAFRWTAESGTVGLGDLPGGPHISDATALSSDGHVVVGYGYGSSGQEAFRWTLEDGMVGLGRLPGDTFSAANAVSDDGGLLVGISGIRSTREEAFIWDEQSGMRRLQDVLIASFGLGAELEGWLLYEATGISADGSTIVGWGRNPHGEPEAWLATIPEPSTYAMIAGALCLAVVAQRRLRKTGPSL